MNIKSYQPRKLSIPVTEIEQASFCRLDDNLRSKTLEEEFKSGVKWQKVPTRYLKLSPEEIDSEVKRIVDSAYDRTKKLLLDKREQLEKIANKLDVSKDEVVSMNRSCLLYTSPSPRDATLSRMPSSA